MSDAAAAVPGPGGAPRRPGTAAPDAQVSTLGTPMTLSQKMGGLRVGGSHFYDEIVADPDALLPRWDLVREGRLANGLQYHVLPNQVRHTL